MNKVKDFFRNNKSMLALVGLIFFYTLVELGEIDWSLNWIKDIEVWINEFIMAIFAYQLSNILLRKIRIPMIREILSFTIALFVSNSLGFEYSYIESQNTKQWIFFFIRIIITVVLFSLLIFLSFKRGKINGEIELHMMAKQYKEMVHNMPTKEKSQIYNCYYLIKKHREKIELIESLGGVEAIENFVKVDKEMKKHKNDEA